VWLDRLPKKLQKKVLKDVGNKTDSLNLKGDPKLEAFASWVGLYVGRVIEREFQTERGQRNIKKGFKKFNKKTELQKKAEKYRAKQSPEEKELMKFFEKLVNDFLRVWKAIKDMLGLGSHPKSFQQFVDAHLQYQRVIDGNIKPDSPLIFNKLKTPLARAIFMEFNAIDEAQVGYLPEEITHGPKPVVDDFNVIDTAQTVQRASSSVLGNYVEDMQRMGRRFVANPADAFKAMFYTIDARLRSMDSATALELAQQFHVRPGEKASALTVIREIYQRGNTWHRKLNDVLTNIPGAKLTTRELAQMSVNRIRRRPGPPTTPAQQTRERILVALQKRTPRDQLSPDIRDHVLAVREYLSGKNGLYNWYTNVMDLELRFLPDYFPLMLDTENMTGRRDEFIQLLVDHGENITRSQAEETYQRIMRDANGGLTVGYNEAVSTDFFGPGFSARKGRAGKNPSRRTLGEGEGFWTEELRQKLIDGGFYQQDLATTLIAYTEMIVRRAVWEKRFRETDKSGRNRQLYEHYDVNIHSPVAKLQLKLTQAHQRQNGNDRLTDLQYNDIIKDILPAYSGQLGLRIHPRLRKLNSTIIIYQNIRLLPLAVLSSFVDLPTLMARSGPDMNAWSDVFQTMLNGTTRAEAMQMLLELGGMRINLTEHVLNDQALNTFETGTAKRINDLFFKYNMMEGWTNLIRAAAAYSGRSFIQRNSAKALQGDAVAKEWMEQLGLDEQLMSEAVRWSGMIGQASPKLQAALNRYIDEAMIRPEAAIRPAWMSDPGYSVFAHLKGFLYGFHETFLRRVGNHLYTNVKNKDLSALVHQNLLPMLLLMMLALSGAALAYEVRRHIAGLGKPRPRPAPFGNYLQEVVERSGLPGVFQILIDMEQAEDYGKHWGLAVGGPAVEQLYDFLTTDDWSYTVARSLPLVAQSPRLTDWVRDSF
jgi:hypothetical protein